MRELSAELNGRLISIGQGAGPIEINVGETDEGLAGDLVGRYGDAVRLTVGLLRYPIDEASSVCAAEVGDPPPEGLEMRVVAPDAPLTRHGIDTTNFEVQVTNTGDVPIQFTSGITRGTIVDANGAIVGSAENVPVAMVGIGVDLAPGATTTLPGVVTLASCDASVGYAIPPGEYQLLASVSVNADGVTRTARAEPAAITIA